jgi:protein subunit release factor A
MIDPNDIDTLVWRGPEAETPLAVRMAVRLIHKPTGIMAESSEQETQIANRETAMRELERRVSEASPDIGKPS